MTQIKRVGVIGGGQLAWMMAPPAKALGLELVIQTPHPSDPAASIATHTVLASISDATATAELATLSDVITFENEFVNLEALALLESQGICFRPRLKSLEPLLDKYNQRCYTRDLGLPTPKFMLLEAVPDPNQLELPIVLKARRHGYDGQGTFVVREREHLERILQKFAPETLLVEEFVPFTRELAVMAARSTTGEIVVYPVVETQQEDQVCRRVIAPAEVSRAVATQVETIARTLLTRLEVVGIFGIELFLTTAGDVLVNEIAPRTHNSGHYTIDACQTSQFEQHLRVVCGLPLGQPNLICSGAIMVNLLGYEQATSDYLEKRQHLAMLPHAFVHWYGKTESRPGRKLGHVTVLLPEPHPEPIEIAQQVEAIWYPQ